MTNMRDDLIDAIYSSEAADCIVRLEFTIGERPYTVHIDQEANRLAAIEFRGYDACTMPYPEGPFADDAKAVAEALFNVFVGA